MLINNEWVPNATYAEMPDGFGLSRMEDFIHSGIASQRTVQINGPHGIGKTKTVEAIPNRYPGVRVVRLSAANLTPDEMITNAPVKLTTAEGKLEYALRELLMEQLTQQSDGSKFLLHVDDSLQANALLQNQFMQIACNWGLGSFDLRKEGCIGVVFTDNESLAETSSRRGDLALLDRMSTIRITAADVAWKEALAHTFPKHDLTEVFKVRGEMPADMRNHVMSPRCLEHVIANLIEGNPGIWGLPLLNGKRVRLQRTDGDNVSDQTVEYISKFARALGAPNPETVPDPVRRVARQAIRNGWTVLFQGDPGTGKTEVLKEVVEQEIGGDPMKYYFSMSTTDVDMLSIPIAMDQKLVQTLREDFYSPEKKVMIWDEYNRPKDPATFAKLMEVTQEWTVAGKAIPGMVAQFAIQNPPLVMGRKMSVSRSNIAQADRFFASIEIGPNDIPANEWLLNEFPKKWARKMIEVRDLRGEAKSEAEEVQLAETDTAEARRVIETVLEWFKNDIDDEGRNWVTARGRERLAEAALMGRELEEAMIYLGEGERAPVVLANLYARLADNPMTGLQELTANLDEWVKKVIAGQNASVHGTTDTDTVHKAFMFAETSQLREHVEAVVTLLLYLPPKYRLTYLTADGDRRTFWMDALKLMKERNDELEKKNKK
jgi:MoxR-like ATPase